MGERREWVRAWKPEVPGIHEVFHARFVDHAYPAHTHDTWTVFIVDEGAIRYDLDASHRGAAGARVTLLPPHVAHDGRAARTDGYRKRVLYLDTEVLPQHMIGRAVDRPDVEDAWVVHRFRTLHHVLSTPHDPLEAESLLGTMCERILLHLTGDDVAPPGPPQAVLAAQLRDFLDERRFEPVTLAEAGRALHASPAHLVRSFSRAFGIAPHRYVMGRRIDASRRRLLDGEPVASVAAGVGFHDQPHFTRQFRRHVGTTPARYAAGR